MNRLLIVVDMQNDFVTDALRNEQAIKVVSNVVAKVEEYMRSGDPVVYTFDTHSEDYTETEEGRNLPVKHCIKGTDGWKLVPELEELANYSAARFNKPTFGSSDLLEYLQKLPDQMREGHSIDRIELVGLCTDICVISNAVIAKAALPNVPIYVDAACCAGVTPHSHDVAIEAMKAIQVHVTNEGSEPWR